MTLCWCKILPFRHHKMTNLLLLLLYEITGQGPNMATTLQVQYSVHFSLAHQPLDGFMMTFHFSILF